MITTKGILEGDTGRFAFGVAFQKDPDVGAGATREEALSWGGVQIWVEGQNLCAHREGDTIVEQAHWYLLPLFEWLSACWDHLLHEERLPLRVAGDDSWNSLQATAKSPPALDETAEEIWDVEWQHWWLRHSLLACRQGGLFPDVMFRRWRDRVEISWGQPRLAGQPDYFRFLSGEGFARLPVAGVAEPIYSVLRQAADYLVSQVPDSERFTKLREALDSLKRHGARKRLALLAGLGSTVDEQEKRWDEVFAQLATKPAAASAATSGIRQTDLFLEGSCQAALMFGSVAPTIDATDAVVLAGKLIDLYSPDSESPELLELVREEVIDDSRKRPWAQGYKLAEEILEDLSLPGGSDEWVDVRQIYAQLGISVDDLPLNDRGIRAVSLAGPEHRPSTLLNPNHVTYQGEAGQRFTLAHELCHILFDRVYGASLAIASGPWAPSDIEARANAFAAMLLMPTELVRRLVPYLSQPVNSVAGAREVASKLHTSFKATLEHLKNLNFLSDEEHDRIEIEVEE
jgi:Zn-dependent peptidase ImmA (M78 family)